MCLIQKIEKTAEFTGITVNQSSLWVTWKIKHVGGFFFCDIIATQAKRKALMYSILMYELHQENLTKTDEDWAI